MPAVALEEHSAFLRLIPAPAVLLAAHCVGELTKNSGIVQLLRAVAYE